MARFSWTYMAVLLLIGQELVYGAVHGGSELRRRRQIEDSEDLEDKYGEFNRPGRFPQFGQGGFGQNGQNGFGQNGQNGFGQNGQNGFGQNGQGQFGQNGFGQNGQNGQFDQNGFGQNGQNGLGQNGQNGQQNQQQQQPQTNGQAANLQTCLRNCLTTAEYNPVCGSDGVTYFNNGRFECARSCQAGLSMMRNGPCPTSTTAAPAQR